MSCFSGGGGILLCSVMLAFLQPPKVMVIGAEETIGNFSQSPTNHEEVLTRKGTAYSVQLTSPSGGGDDFWVGSHQLEFKPHPLLMAPQATLSPTAQIPIIELGTAPPTASTPIITSGSRDMSKEDVILKGGGEANKKKTRTKKSRDQRRLVHRTLWDKAGNRTAAGKASYVVKSEPEVVVTEDPEEEEEGVTVITGGSDDLSPFGGRKDESLFSGTTWNINHPKNRLMSSANLQQLQQQLQLQNLLAQQPQLFPPSSPGFTQVVDPFPMPSGPPEPEMMQFSQVTGPAAAASSAAGSAGPIFLYVPSTKQATKQPTMIPMKTASGAGFTMNSIPMESMSSPIKIYGWAPPRPSVSIVEPPHIVPNPQYLRNNLLRVVMDKLAIVGKSLPIPFVTKYGHSHHHHVGHHHAHYHHSPPVPHRLYSASGYHPLARRM